jgi:hypothetical protein
MSAEFCWPAAAAAAAGSNFVVFDCERVGMGKERKVERSVQLK